MNGYVKLSCMLNLLRVRQVSLVDRLSFISSRLSYNIDIYVCMYISIYFHNQMNAFNESTHLLLITITSVIYFENH